MIKTNTVEMDTDKDKQERKELARKMALQRSKVVNRRPLTSGKETA